MKLNPEKQQIFVSGRIWHEVYPKVNVTPFIYALNDGIDLSKYGEGIQKFYFTFLVQKTDFFKPAKFYSQKKKEADLSIEIPIEKVENASEEEAIKLMEEAYLQGIDKLAAIKSLADFDVAAFKKDVEAIFAKEKWYEIPEAA